MLEFRGLLGVALLILIALALSERRRAAPLRLAGLAVLLQVVLAIVLLRVPYTADAFHVIAQGINQVILSANAGIVFLFGPALADPAGPVGFVFVVRVLPVFIFFTALIAVLYHLGVMQRLVFGLAWLLHKALRVPGVEALAAAANVFVGQAEAPLTIRPYLPKFTRSQIATLMVGGFATIAGTVLAAYVDFLGRDDPAARIYFLTHLLTASIISAPAAFAISKLLVPETEEPFDMGLDAAKQQERAYNVFDAAARGATDGLKLAGGIAAMLIAFVSLLALVNWPMAALTDWAFGTAIDLQTAIGWLLSPLAWLIGVEWASAGEVGRLIGEKLILTEFIAFGSLGELVTGTDGQAAALQGRNAIIAVYALCGFSNFASIAVQIGALSVLAPGQRETVVSLGFKAMIGGLMASLMTAAIAGLVI